jgi:hypothetical protein
LGLSQAGYESRHRRVVLHTPLAGPWRHNHRQSPLGIQGGQRFVSATATWQFGFGLGSLRAAGGAAGPTGPQTQSTQFLGSRCRLRIAVRLASPKQLAGDDDQLTGGRHHRYVAILLVRQPPEEDAEWTGMRPQVLGSLD